MGVCVCVCLLGGGWFLFFDFRFYFKAYALTVSDSAFRGLQLVELCMFMAWKLPNLRQERPVPLSDSRDPSCLFDSLLSWPVPLRISRPVL